MSKKFKTGVETTTLKVTSGSPAVGKILTTDASGNATPVAFPPVRINHGSTASTARPTQLTTQPVEWIGSVAPTNALDGDTWIDIS